MYVYSEYAKYRIKSWMIFISYGIIFHVNNYKPTFAQPCIYERKTQTGSSILSMPVNTDFTQAIFAAVGQKSRT